MAAEEDHDCMLLPFQVGLREGGAIGQGGGERREWLAVVHRAGVSRQAHGKKENPLKADERREADTAVQRQMERERVSATMISATPNVPRRGAYQGVIRILAANVNKNISAGPAIARSTPKSNKGRP